MFSCEMYREWASISDGSYSSFWLANFGRRWPVWCTLAVRNHGGLWDFVRISCTLLWFCGFHITYFQFCVSQGLLDTAHLQLHQIQFTLLHFQWRKRLLEQRLFFPLFWYCTVSSTLPWLRAAQVHLCSFPCVWFSNIVLGTHFTVQNLTLCPQLITWALLSWISIKCTAYLWQISIILLYTQSKLHTGFIVVSFQYIWLYCLVSALKYFHSLIISGRIIPIDIQCHFPKNIPPQFISHNNYNAVCTSTALLQELYIHDHILYSS